MKAGTIGASLVAGSGAVLSSLCCLLPLTVIVLGLGSGAFMAVTMRYRWLLIPRACWRSPRDFSSTLASGDGATRSAAGWRAAGSRAILLCASVIAAASIVLDRFPEVTANLLAQLAGGGHSGAGHDMKGMGGR